MTPQEIIQKNIKTHGLSIMGVSGDGDNPPFAYTVGLTETKNHPEIIVFGLRAEVAATLFNSLVELIPEGGALKDGDVVHEIANFPVALKQVPDKHAAEYCFQAIYRYEDMGGEYTPTFLQMVITDSKGLFPWDEGYDKAQMCVQTQLWV